jgi:hypothetical protein
LYPANPARKFDVLNTRDGDQKIGRGLDGLIQAAGGVISRRRPGGIIEVLLIYRDRQQGRSWRLAKHMSYVRSAKFLKKRV